MRRVLSVRGEKRNINLPVRLSREEWKAFERLAQKDSRSVTGQLSWLVRRYLLEQPAPAAAEPPARPIAKDLPGADLIQEGLEDLARHRESPAAFLVSIGAERLRRSGVRVEPFSDPEVRLYQALAREDSDSAHSRYNALIGRLVSFERALECAS